mmetsp:Transcript_30343/g.46440  ORF Transcript_30343/g.46440 Transcript_30343/m.46440 type:complete len:149 (+) Transcript_30343:454-900(+)
MNQRWDDFRSRRADTVNEYLKLKARQKRLEQWIKQVRTLKFVSFIAKYFENVKIEKTKKAKSEFAMFRCKYQWKKRKRMFGGFEQLMLNNIRNVFTSQVALVHDAVAEEKQETILIPFLKEYSYREGLKQKFRRSRQLLVFIQSRFMA